MPLPQRKNTEETQKRRNFYHDMICDTEVLNSILSVHPDMGIILLVSVALQCSERKNMLLPIVTSKQMISFSFFNF